MDGLIIRLLDDKTGAWWFWRIFEPIRRDLDRMFWCLNGQPWMGWPEDFGTADAEPFENARGSCIHLWRPGTLGRFAEEFGEEFVELWAVEPTRDDPARLASEYAARDGSVDVIRQHARIWLLYTDSTCWEIYARKPDLLNRVRAGIDGKSWAKAYPSHSERRRQSFGDAGLSDVWQALGD